MSSIFNERRGVTGRGAWRWALFASLALVAGACGDVPSNEPDGAEGEQVAAAEEGLVCLTVENTGVITDRVGDAVIVFNPSDPSRASTNFGQVTQMNAGYVGTAYQRVMLRFDLAAAGIPADVTVGSATLTLRMIQSLAKNPVDVYASTGLWSEDLVTWNQVGGFPNGGVGAPVTSFATLGVANNSNVNLTLPASLVQGWLDPQKNFGLLLEHPLAGRTTIGGSEASSVGPRPKLHVCYTPPSCNDGIQNQGETAVDCGGPSCPACPSCSDGIQNGDETAVDCGGSCAIPEVCNGLDDDCDGQIDEGVKTTYYQDLDHDGFGNAAATALACSLPAGYAVNAGDCNDASAAVRPGGVESCNGVDDDCDGATDEGSPGAGQACTTGLPGVCSPGSTGCNGGANTCVPLLAPTVETCNGLDDDCDGSTDEGNPGGGIACSTGVPGVCAPGVTACASGVGICAPFLSPSLETCNGLDDDCDGVADEDGACCSPTTCQAQGVSCGVLADGCGGTLNCGTCGTSGISAGRSHTCALTGDGTVKCWGDNTFGQLGDGTTFGRYAPVLVSGLNSIAAVASGAQHTCALRVDGTVWCWGNNAYGQLGDGTITNRATPAQVTGVAGATAISASASHTCAALQNGGVQCWGYNGYAELGDGTTVNRTTPVTVAGLSGVVTVAAGSLHTCAALADGTARCWGNNTYGQLGDGTTTNRSAPVVVGALSGATGISAAAEGNSTCAVLASGSVKCWGDNGFGQLGDGTTTQRTIPVAAVGLTTAVEVSLHDAHACARLTDNTAKCWGYNGTGALGDGTTTNRLTPTPMTSVPSARSVAAGYRHTCVLMIDGSARCAGDNPSGQLGDESTVAHAFPQSVYAFPCGGGGTSNVCVPGCTPTTCQAQGVTSGTLADGCGGTLFCGPGDRSPITGGKAFTCAITPDSHVKCWGSNANGQLGDGTTWTRYEVAGEVLGLDDAIALTAGWWHACALKADHTVACWGANSFGQLGDGTTTQRTTPVLVAQLSNVQSVSAGRYHTCAVLTDGTTRCWGFNEYGQLGDGSVAPTSTPVTVVQLGGAVLGGVVSIGSGRDHTCASLSNGLVRCWGDNVLDQLGNGLVPSLAPVSVYGISNAIGVVSAASGWRSCALLADGSVTCWGANTGGGYHLLPAEVVGLSGATALSANGSHWCARLANGTVPCWGAGGSMSGVTTAVAVATGDVHTCVLLADGTARCAGDNDSGQVGDQTAITRATSVPVYAFPCGGGGTSNVCVPGCTPTTCQAEGVTSGVVADGCGGTLYCGPARRRHIAASASFSCAVTSSGGVKCWGENGSGQLGDGTTTDRLTPVAVGGLSGAVEVATGETHACAVKSDGMAFCWGSNVHGQLGTGVGAGNSISTTPVAVAGISSAVSIAAGIKSACAVLADGTGRCWGYNGSGELGDGTVLTRTTPVTIVGLGGIVTIGGNSSHTCVSLQNGLARCWGNNDYGELANGGRTTSLTPRAVAGLENVVSLSTGGLGRHSCALLSDGSVKCWGYNWTGQVGDGTTTDRYLALPIAGVSNATSISGNAVHTCASQADGVVKCWGYNGTGLAGDGTTVSKHTPSPMSGITTAVEAAAGSSHTCVLLADDTARCTGDNVSGGLGDGTTTPRLSPVNVLGF